jgi:D-alanine transaminase
MVWPVLREIAMPRIAYVNGRYIAHRDASVHIEDRGYQFADGVYEVCEIARGFIVDMTRHLDRLDRSLSELSIRWPMHRSALILVLREVIRRNRVPAALRRVTIHSPTGFALHWWSPPERSTRKR